MYLIVLGFLLFLINSHQLLLLFRLYREIAKFLQFAVNFFRSLLPIICHYSQLDVDILTVSFELNKLNQLRYIGFSSICLRFKILLLIIWLNNFLFQFENFFLITRLNRYTKKSLLVVFTLFEVIYQKRLLNIYFYNDAKFFEKQ